MKKYLYLFVFAFLFGGGISLYKYNLAQQPSIQKVVEKVWQEKSMAT